MSPPRYTLIRKKGQPDQLVLDRAGHKGWRVVEEGVVAPRVASDRVSMKNGRRAWKVRRVEAQAVAWETRWRGMTRGQMAQEIMRELALRDARLEALEQRLARLDELAPPAVGKK